MSVPSASAPQGLPFGPDVSSWQHLTGQPMDWAAVARSGVSFAIVKATEGVGYTNPWFGADYGGSGSAGLVRGAYHFARPALPLSSAVDQARYYLAAAGRSGQNGDLAPILDLEVTGGLSAGQLVAWTQVWLSTVQAATGRAPVIYTYPYFWYSAMGDTSAFARYPLWWASYTGGSRPAPVPGGWPGWLIWQYTANGAVPTATGPTDLSVFASSAALRAASTVQRPSGGDSTPPAVVLYPPAVAAATVTVTWGGADSGDGVACADLYLAVDGGLFHPWRSRLTPSYRSGTFAAGRASLTGRAGHRYTFVGRVRDRTGNLSAWSHWQNARL